MGTIISLDEYRKKRCMEALLREIGLPGYCQECGDCEEEPLSDADMEILAERIMDAFQMPSQPAVILPFTGVQTQSGRTPRRKQHS